MLIADLDDYVKYTTSVIKEYQELYREVIKLRIDNNNFIESLQYIADNPDDSFEAPQIAQTALKQAVK